MKKLFGDEERSRKEVLTSLFGPANPDTSNPQLFVDNPPDTRTQTPFVDPTQYMNTMDPNSDVISMKDLLARRQQGGGIQKRESARTPEPDQETKLVIKAKKKETYTPEELKELGLDNE